MIKIIQGLLNGKPWLLDAPVISQSVNIQIYAKKDLETYRLRLLQDKFWHTDSSTKYKVPRFAVTLSI